MSTLTIAVITAACLILAVLCALAVLWYRHLPGHGDHAAGMPPEPVPPAGYVPEQPAPPPADSGAWYWPPSDLTRPLPRLPDMLPAPAAGPGVWLPSTPQLDDTVRYLADAGCLDPETEIEQARLREELAEIGRGMTARLRMTEPGADSHVRTDASAPGWLGATAASSHRSPDWREQTAVDLDPDTLAGQAAVLPPALASVPLDDYSPDDGEWDDDDQEYDEPWKPDDAEREAIERDREIESETRDPDAAGLLALPAAPECSCVLGNDPLTATTPISLCPVHRDDDAEPDPDEWAFQQARAYVLSVAEQAAYTADEAIAYAALTGYPQDADPVWAGCSGPWLLLEDEAERLVSAA